MLLIYVPQISSRCRYVFDFIFEKEFNIEYQLTADPEKFAQHAQEKMNYSYKRKHDEFYIHASSFLFEHEIKKINIPAEKKFGTTILFANDGSCDAGFDIFSAVFFMISRYEEYLPFAPDKYGRFTALASFAFQHNFLQHPVVDIWINIFKKSFAKRFPHLQLNTSSFNYSITYDIDIAYAFKGRNILRLIGATIQDAIQLKFKNIFYRIGTHFNLKRDPWDVYDSLYEMIVKNKMPSIFFFLFGDYSTHDKNLNHTHTETKKLVNKISSFSEIGIHPSFHSSVKPAKISIEKMRLEKISGKEISKSRQHYLRFNLPGTFNQLSDAGIKEEYSMCFTDAPGFRAGTCKPFYFYDLKNERRTDLKIFPVTFMEGTYMDYMKLSPEKALDDIYRLIEEVKNVQGTFISIWHNHTLSETGIYKGWRAVHDKMIEKILLHS